MSYPKLFFLSSILTCTLTLSAQTMDNDNLEKILYVIGDTLAGQSGNWQMIVDEIPIFILTDEYHNRMRMVSPVKKAAELTEEEQQKCMEANFHSALDVRYAIADDVLWVAYIHPLKELTKEQAIDAISQVYNAVLTFGTTYSSTDLVFSKTGKKREKEREKVQEELGATYTSFSLSFTSHQNALFTT